MIFHCTVKRTSIKGGPVSNASVVPDMDDPHGDMSL
jgi:hypothetical protein